ncbi:hypothetical protein [Mesorhizobium sp. SP-1A]|jgi:hypothetical protein|uniref:hypothetical protein n=1 Tax=Mesorhizobium sp. SP-1A TaxID=3077840 RepID=UPI0028F70EA2|nr:hypothetical protein [Mesorhizobium sp. SP-1A]
MSRALEDIAKTSDLPQGRMTLDQQVASILIEIEREKVPDRLLELAGRLQALLLEKRRGG